MTANRSEHSPGNQSAFVELLGSPGRVKMLEAFLDNHETTLTAKDVADYADISESTFSRNADLFLDLDLIEQTDQVGKTRFFSLNKESPLAEDLARAQYHLLEQVPGVEPERWTTDDEPSEAVDVGEPTAEEERVAEILPKLFVEESEADREELLSELADIAAHDPETITDAIPAVIELVHDENRAVAERALWVMRGAAMHDPELLEGEYETIFRAFGEVIDAVEPLSVDEFDSSVEYLNAIDEQEEVIRESDGIEEETIAAFITVKDAFEVLLARDSLQLLGDDSERRTATTGDSPQRIDDDPGDDGFEAFEYSP